MANNNRHNQTWSNGLRWSSIRSCFRFTSPTAMLLQGRTGRVHRCRSSKNKSQNKALKKRKLVPTWDFRSILYSGPNVLLHLLLSLELLGIVCQSAAGFERDGLWFYTDCPSRKVPVQHGHAWPQSWSKEVTHLQGQRLFHLASGLCVWWFWCAYRTLRIMWTSGSRILNFALLHLSGKCSHSNTKWSDLGIDHPDPNIMPVYAFQTSCIAQSPSGLKATERMNVWKSAACSRAIAKLLSISSYLFTSPSNNEKAAEKKCRCWKRFGVCSLALKGFRHLQTIRSKPLAGPPSQWCRSDPVRRVQYCDVTTSWCWDISGAGDTTCRALLFASLCVTKPWSFQRVRGPWRWNLGALLLHPARRWIAAPVKNEQITHQDRHHQASPSTECATNSWTKKYHKELGHTTNL